MKEILKFWDKVINLFIDNDLVFVEEFMECLKFLKIVIIFFCIESMFIIFVIMFI